MERISSLFSIIFIGMLGLALIFAINLSNVISNTTSTASKTDTLKKKETIRFLPKTSDNVNSEWAAFAPLSDGNALSH